MVRLEWIFHCQAMQYSSLAGSTSLYVLFYSSLFQIMRYKLAVACQWSFLPSVLASLLWLSPINTRRSVWKLLWLSVPTILLRSVITRNLLNDLLVTSWFIGNINWCWPYSGVFPFPCTYSETISRASWGTTVIERTSLQSRYCNFVYTVYCVASTPQRSFT